MTNGVSQTLPPASDPQRRRWLNLEQLLSVLPLKKSRIYYLVHTNQIPYQHMWQQSENVVFEQSRNVVLTAPSSGDAGRTSTYDAG